MIKIGQGGFAEMWKGTVPVEAQCISYALQKADERMKESLLKTMAYAAMDRVDEKVLDYLAVENQALYYDQSLPIEAKRKLIKASFSGWYTKAGTPAAVEELVQAVFGEGEVVEWFDNGAAPFTFDIRTNAAMTEDMLERFQSLVGRVKNERSHLRQVLVIRKLGTEGKAAAAAITTPQNQKIIIREGEANASI